MKAKIHTLLIDSSLKKIAEYANKHNASDIHISTENGAFMRVHGTLIKIKFIEINHNIALKMFNSISNDKQKAEIEKNRECDFSLSITSEIRVRINAFYTMNGLSISARFIQTGAVKSLAQLNLPSVLEKACSLAKGLILITGPTGSGKSTTIASMIAHINENYNHHIITIEDPIEFIHKSKNSLIQQREVGSSSSGFASSVRASLRQDPDIIMIGEMRDIETIKAALHVAETGHLVLGTLHTNSASSTINRIINAFPKEEQITTRSLLSESLKIVVSQRLILTKERNSRCGAFEIMIVNNAISNLILENKIAQIDSLIEINRKSGMMLMKSSIQNLLKNQIVDENEAQELLKSYD